MSKRVTIIGMGLIGSSIARALRKHKADYVLGAFDTSADVRKTVRQLKMVDSVFDDIADAVKEADVVMLCVPVGAMRGVAQAMAAHLKQGAIVTDVGSTKQSVVDALLPVLPDYVHLIPGHPVAGAENSGPESGFAELFEKRLVILTPSEAADKNAVQTVTDLWVSVKAYVKHMPVIEHDEILALTSHLPHVIAFGLMGAIVDKGDVKSDLIFQCGGGSFRDLTRVAAADPIMWRDIFLVNQEAIATALETLKGGIEIVQNKVKSGDVEALTGFLQQMRSVRRSLPHLDYDDGDLEAERFNKKH